MINFLKQFVLLSVMLCSSVQAEILLTAEELDYIAANPTVRVHNELDWIPFNFNENGQPKGYSIDYMNLISEKLGLKVEYVNGPTWSDFLVMMQERTLDLMVNIASTADRRTYLTFTEPFLITYTSLYVRNSENSISDLSDLAGKKLAFTKGFFFGEFIHKYYPEIETITFDSTLDSFIGVEKGLADAAIEVPVVGQRILRNAKMNSLKLGGRISDPRFITTFSIATHKDERILSEIIQKGMDAITSAEENLIRKKWKIEVTESPLITEEDEARLKALQELHLCVNPDYLPLEAINHQGELTGISSELVKLIEEHLKIPFKILKTSSWEQSLLFSEQGKCDLIPMVVKSESTEQHLNFTSPWLSVPIAVATRRDQIYISNIEQVIEQKIGVVQGMAVKEILLLSHSGINLIEVGSVEDGLKQVNNGTLFGFVDTIPAISRVLQTNALTEVKISGDLGLSIDYAIGINPDSKPLLNIIERVLDTIDKNQISNIYNRWLAITYIERFDYTRFWQVLIGIVIISLYFTYRYRQGIRITAELRTAHKEVEAANQKLMRLAKTDALTSIANRLSTDEFLSGELNRYERYGGTFSVILLDIDHFKEVNDRHGHLAGDEVLKSIAKTLDKNIRENDHLGRWGGEEFLIICPSTSVEGVVKLAESLRQEIENNVIESIPSPTASFGIATIDSGESVQELIKRADEALYCAKSKGRNCVVSFG